MMYKDNYLELLTVCSERSAFSEILLILSNNSSIVLYASSSAWNDTTITMVTDKQIIITDLPS